MTGTLMLVDDHPLFRRGMKELILSRCDLFNDVVEADNGKEALDQIERVHPCCVVLDIAMPGLDGLQTLQLIKERHPGVRCIVLSMYNNQEFVMDARDKGAQGYVLKTDSDDTILECLQRVNDGQLYVSTSVQQPSSTSVPEVEVSVEDIHSLSTREKQILSHIARNQTSKEISEQLSLSVRTIQNHRVNICRKLGLSGSNALLKLAITHQAWLV